MPRIFVSYRFDDSETTAERIIAQLQEYFGPDAVLHEADGAPLDINIRKHLAAVVSRCGVLVAIIGKNWLAAAPEGRTGIQDLSDFQRVTIESAMSAGIHVVPVFADKAPRYHERELPASLAELAFLSGLSIDDGPNFASQMECLIKGIEEHVRQPGPQAQAAPAAAPPETRDDKDTLEARRIEALHQAEREIREKTSSMLLLRTAQQKTKLLHVFRDIPVAPEMVTIPTGHFLMGSPSSEAGRNDNEGPQHEVLVRRFAAGKYPVTFDEYAIYARAAGIDLPDDEGWGRGRRPVINVSWNDAQAYLQWLNQEAQAELDGRYYRLLSEAEWEYVCRAGTTTPYYTGAVISTDQANFDGHFSHDDGRRGRSLKATLEVGSYPPNPWGLYDMLGNVWEWVGDRFHENYHGAPKDGTTWESGKSTNRVLRGGSWDSTPDRLRSAYRNMSPADNYCSFDGFRIARTL